MKPISEQDHYEILETTREASPKEIERAYRLQKATYTEDSLANSSLFGDADIAVLRERIEVAYRVLGDADKRQAYDEGLEPHPVDSAVSEDPVRVAGDVERADSEADTWTRSELDPMGNESADSSEEWVAQSANALGAEPKEAVASPAAASEYEEVDEEGGDFDGPRLHRMRMRRDVSIDQISAITKINPLYLRYIEEERGADLPAAVYVRGFVRAYASFLGLDPDAVARSYMERFEEARELVSSGSGRPGLRRRSRRTA